MLLGLKSNAALEVLHFPTLEDFRALERVGDARSTPLSGRCDSARAQLALPSIHLTVQRTFPRILEANYRALGAICFIPLASSVNVTINGIFGTPDHVMTVRGQASCEIVEPTANLFALVNLSPTITDRGWPDCAEGVRVLRVGSGEALRAFRRTVESLLAFASLDPRQAQNIEMLRRMEETLLSALDDMMTSQPAISSPEQFERYRRTVRRMDDYLLLHPAADIYGEELAKACDVSPRTLQTATQAVRGLSVHRYLRLRRLWSVRRALGLGRPHTRVSDVARANGFWHMGEFASAYRAIFGETPTDTLARRS